MTHSERQAVEESDGLGVVVDLGRHLAETNPVHGLSEDGTTILEGKVDWGWYCWARKVSFGYPLMRRSQLTAKSSVRDVKWVCRDSLVSEAAGVCHSIRAYREEADAADVGRKAVQDGKGDGHSVVGRRSTACVTRVSFECCGSLVHRPTQLVEDDEGLGRRLAGGVSQPEVR